MVIASSAERGFTLLEAMIAMAVAAIALTALLALGNRCIGTHDELRHITQATLLAGQKMSELETLHGLGRPSEVAPEGQFAEPFDDFRWGIVFTDTLLAEVQEVTVQVSWGRRRSHEQVSLTSFLLRQEAR